MGVLGLHRSASIAAVTGEWKTNPKEEQRREQERVPVSAPSCTDVSARVQLRLLTPIISPAAWLTPITLALGKLRQV